MCSEPWKWDYRSCCVGSPSATYDQSNCCRRTISVSLFHVACDDCPLILLTFSLSLTVDPLFSVSLVSAGRSPQTGHTIPRPCEKVFGMPHCRHILMLKRNKLLNIPMKLPRERNTIMEDLHTSTERGSLRPKLCSVLLLLGYLICCHVDKID